MAPLGLYVGLLELNSVLGGCWHLLGTVHSATSLGTVKVGLRTVCGAGTVCGAIGTVHGAVGTVCGAIGTVHGAVRAEFGAGGLLALTRDCT